MHSLRMEGPPGEADLDDSGLEFVSPIELSLRVVRQGETFWVEAVVRASVVLECARCLRRYTEHLESEFRIMVQRGGSRPEGEEEEDVKVVAQDAEYVDITQEVHDFVLLSVPMKPLCSEDCKGLCPVCGADLNEIECGCRRERIDPRWEALTKIAL